ncbi:MAG: hypothetical protein JWN21_1785 [Sphingomonas bacterium]|nr:hypothetical protein [Sphingomonas bacterium]
MSPSDAGPAGFLLRLPEQKEKGRTRRDSRTGQQLICTTIE